MENSQDHVWISREEYDRLRQVQPQQQVPAPTIYSSNTIAMAEGDKPATPFTVIQVVAGAVLAFLSFTYPPAIVLFGIFALISIFDYYRSRKQHTATNNRKSMNTVYLLLIILPLVLLALPLVAFVGFIAFMLFICSFDDGCKGS